MFINLFFVAAVLILSNWILSKWKELENGKANKEEKSHEQN